MMVRIVMTSGDTWDINESYVSVVDAWRAAVAISNDESPIVEFKLSRGDLVALDCLSIESVVSLGGVSGQ